MHCQGFMRFKNSFSFPSLRGRKSFFSHTFLQNIYLSSQIEQQKIFSIFLFKSTYNDTLRTFAWKFSNIDFHLNILPLKDEEIVMSEM